MQIISNVPNYIKINEGESGAVQKAAVVWRKVVVGVQIRKIRIDAGISKILQNNHADLIRRIIYDAHNQKLA